MAGAAVWRDSSTPVTMRQLPLQGYDFVMPGMPEGAPTAFIPLGFGFQLLVTYEAGCGHRSGLADNRLDSEASWSKHWPKLAQG